MSGGEEEGSSEWVMVAKPEGEADNEGTAKTPTAVSPAEASTTTTTPTTPAQPVEEKEPEYYYCKGKYKRLDKLGTGAQGRVFKCLAVETGEIYAVKEVPMSASDLNTKQKQAEDQRDLLKGGPHITRIVDIFPEVNENEEDGVSHKLCTVMDYIAKGDLGGVIADATKYFPEETILSVGLQILDAINFLHTKSIFHMDVKPDNILVADKKDGLVVYLTDFDACRSCTGKQSVDTDTAFTAPEVLAESHCSAAADVFGLGVVLFCFTTLPEFPDLDNDMLWSDRWKDSDVFAEEIKKHFAKNRYYKRDGKRIKYTEKLITILTNMLAYDPSKRPSVPALLNQVNDLYADLLTGVVVPDTI